MGFVFSFPLRIFLFRPIVGRYRDLWVAVMGFRIGEGAFYEIELTTACIDVLKKAKATVHSPKIR